MSKRRVGGGEVCLAAAFDLATSQAMENRGCGPGSLAALEKQNARLGPIQRKIPGCDDGTGSDEVQS
jgi:hypothetical protein